MISIITPVYNGEKFVANCIQNVIDQNCSDIEHIIVDGGSSDRTIEVVKSHAKNYSHIRWISEKDKGQSDAMNKGIKIAKGEIIGILNIDDFYTPNVLNQALKIFKELPNHSFLVGNCNLLDNEGNVIGINKPSKLKLYNLILGDVFPYNPSAYFYHVSLHKKAGLYDVNDHYSMDLDFILRVVQVANITYVDEAWGNFLQHDHSKTIKDKQENQADLRVSTLLRRYRKNLPIWRRIQLELKERYPAFEKFLSNPFIVDNTSI
jgi:glycosyltransferase involved in cell wall biosynthesis